MLDYNSRLREITGMLKNNRDDWHQVLDLLCGRQIHFSRVDTGSLDMIVCRRSGDVLEADAVCFSMLQEYLSVMIGCEVGRCWHVTNNFYLRLDDDHEKLMNDLATKTWPSGKYSSSCPYQSGEVTTTPLIPGGDVDKFDANVTMMLDEPDALGMTDWFVKRVGGPMLRAIQIYKSKEHDQTTRVALAQNILTSMPRDSDWWCAGYEWLERRKRS